jgi:hypothetical protein
MSVEKGRPRQDAAPHQPLVAPDAILPGTPDRKPRLRRVLVDEGDGGAIYAWLEREPSMAWSSLRDRRYPSNALDVQLHGGAR